MTATEYDRINRLRMKVKRKAKAKKVAPSRQKSDNRETRELETKKAITGLLTLVILVKEDPRNCCFVELWRKS